MDGMHDLGGKQGFATVVRDTDPRIFHHDWEFLTNAISTRLVLRGVYSMDEYRHAIERMAPAHYISASYYERVLTAAATLCIEKGIFSAAALSMATEGGTFPLAGALGPGRESVTPERPFQIGNTVRVKNEFVVGHTRMPGYIRGHSGVIVGSSPLTPYPDGAAHGIHGPMEQTFDVSFDVGQLWPASADPASIHVAVFASYLEHAA
jgi:nitrile hydratase beta subunit